MVPVMKNAGNEPCIGVPDECVEIVRDFGQFMTVENFVGENGGTYPVHLLPEAVLYEALSALKAKREMPYNDGWCAMS